jgi:hypothetical protein
LVVEDVGGDAEGLGDRGAEGRAVATGGRDDEDAAVVVAEAELPARAQHAVGPLAAHLAPGDLHPSGHDRAEGREGDQVALGHVEGTAGDLQGLAVAGVDIDQLDLVGVGVRAQGQHLRHDDAVEALADALDRLDRHAEVAHDVAEGDGVVVGEGRELPQPGEEDLHAGNCSRKRTSPVNISRMSSTP